MAEYLIQDTTLTGIADKIRPLLGLTGTMTPEQMQTNLTTEQANITAALAALAEKGVEVPAGANSNALAGLIAAIEAGGGNVAYGSFVIPDYPGAHTHTIETGLNGDIKYFAIWRDAINHRSTYTDLVCVCTTFGSKFTSSNTGYVMYQSSKGSITLVKVANAELQSDYGINTSDDSNYNRSKIVIDMTAAGIYLINSDNYRWMAIAWE